MTMSGDGSDFEPVPLAAQNLTVMESEDPGGPAFVVKNEGSKPQFFYVYGDSMLIGRSDDVHLPVNLKSISRHHARVSVGREGVVIEDLMSENGTYVNGVRVERRVLRLQDQVTLGTFVLVYVGAKETQQIYDGVPIKGLERYTRIMSGFDVEATFRVPLALIERRNEVSRLLHHGLLRADSGSDQWALKDKVLKFGKDADVVCSELLVKGVLAELSWSGRRHELRRAARRATVKVNGKKIEQQELKDGDKVQVGRSRFVYTVEA
jgi:pSer/pThr/pTyr-binding forkhead associated (FHA) protein